MWISLKNVEVGSLISTFQQQKWNCLKLYQTIGYLSFQRAGILHAPDGGFSNPATW